MTTVTMDTFVNTATIFIRDVLRNKLVDVQNPVRPGSSWIFKGEPEDRAIDYPYIILSSGRDLNPITGNNARKRISNFKVGAEIWANKIADKDNLSDQIVKFLRNPTSADSAGDTLGSKHIHLKSATDDDDDKYVDETNLVRIKLMTLNFSYSGA